MRKHNQSHTLGTLQYKAHFRFLRTLKGFYVRLMVQKIRYTCVWPYLAQLERLKCPTGQ